MRKVLAIILAALPTYFSLFAIPTAAAVIMGVSTMIGMVLSANLEKEEAQLRDKVVMGWIIHLLGICIVVAFHNLKP